MLIDSHCHLDDYEDLPAVLTRAQAAGVSTLLAIGIGDGPETMHRALEIAHQHDHVWATAGIHPQEAHRASPEALARLAALAADPRCLAVGEIGLDYYHVANPDRGLQMDAFIAQLAVAAAARKPITLHCRTSELATAQAKARFGPADAFDNMMWLLDEYWTPHGLGGIMHCFSGNEAEAARALDAGFHLSFAGNVTYSRSAAIQAVAAAAPADRILIETDAPFLTPVPLRGQQNEPAHITHTAAFVAGLRGISTAALAELTTRNFQRLFPATQAVTAGI